MFLIQVQMLAGRVCPKVQGVAEAWSGPEKPPALVMAEDSPPSQ